MKLKSLLWRVVYVVLCFVVLYLVGPLFLSFIGIPIEGQAMQLLRICFGLIALLYVIFGPDPPALF
jgi:hypothetical protein